MIHTNSISGLDVLELAQKEIDLYLKYGVYPLIENYYGSTADCEQVLSWLHETHPTAIYGINILGGRQEDEEAEDYLLNYTLNDRIHEISEALLQHKGKAVYRIFGEIDAMKVQSSMTLFDAISPNDVFGKVLDQFYGGVRDKRTLELLGEDEDDIT